MDYRRGYVITVIFAVTWGLNELFVFYSGSRAFGGLLFEIGGFAIIAMGLYVFARFVREHPRPELAGEGT